VGEDRFGQRIARSKARRKGDPADRAAFAVLLEAAAGEVAAGHAFDRHDLDRPADRDPTPQRIPLAVDDVVLDDPEPPQPPEPPEARGGQQTSLARRRVGQHHVERAGPIGRHHQDARTPIEVRGQVVEVPDLAAATAGEGQVGGDDGVIGGGHDPRCGRLAGERSRRAAR